MNMKEQNILKINERYSDLAETSCCLSCGGAVNHALPQPSEFCVDLGSGRGSDVLRMAESVGAEGFVVGIDIAEGMIDKARRTAEKLGVTNVRFDHAALEYLPIKDDQADLIISNCVLNHADDKTKVWHEIYRVLKPGGRFVISDIYSMQPIPDEFLNAPEAIAECWAGADTREIYMETIHSAGFRMIDVIEESAPYAKGKVEVCSWTIAGSKPKKKSCCCG